MNEIQFSWAALESIVRGRKTQARSPVLHSKEFEDWGMRPGYAYDVTESYAPGAFHFLVAGDHGYTDAIPCPYGAPGDILRVFSTVVRLELLYVGVERLHQITHGGALAEGINPFHHVPPNDSAVPDFKVLWGSCRAVREFPDLYGWKANPWVWVLKFKRIADAPI